MPFISTRGPKDTRYDAVRLPAARSCRVRYLLFHTQDASRVSNPIEWRSQYSFLLKMPFLSTRGPKDTR